MNKNELWKLYCDTEKQVEKARTKRAIKTIAAFAIVFFLLFYFIEKPTGIEIIGDLLVSIVLAGIYFLVNALIFGQLTRVGEKERQLLADLMMSIDKTDENIP